MLSNSSRYGIRAVLYLATRHEKSGNTGIKQISSDLGLPMPFMAKILQLLAKHKILKSIKGPNGGFTLLKDPAHITLFEIVKIIDGDELFTKCLIHDETCVSVEHSKKPCPIHEDFYVIQTELINLFSNRTIADLVSRIDSSGDIAI